MGQRQEGCYSGLDEPPGVTNSYSKTDFIAINAIIHSSAMDKCINPKLGYIKPTSSSKWIMKHLITQQILEILWLRKRDYLI